ncbi:MAG: 23S rRNA (pseudouridine(1915)-N(3))-methyltransferase RlmH [Ruminococcaceae bacterium]|nr:23S rRNA (pseudouridine(1915)-N(3))-methyltransferase RlmH [Oscillospiraceae bacterium]
MITVKFITVGNLKEGYLREAEAEYVKRLGAFCRFENIQLKEVKLPDNPSQSEIENALRTEAKAILDAMSGRAYKVALCVEGKQLPSEGFASLIEKASGEHSEICFVIGSSHGLDESVKRAANIRLSVSELTFPHQLMRIILLEAVYRAFNIIKGTKYHK